LLTTENLIWRNIIQPTIQLCAGVAARWTILIIFLSCDFFGNLWHSISNWLGFITVSPEHGWDHFLQFGNLGRFPKNIRLVFNLIGWLLCGWFGAKEILGCFVKKMSLIPNGNQSYPFSFCFKKKRCFFTNSSRQN